MSTTRAVAPLGAKPAQREPSFGLAPLRSNLSAAEFLIGAACVAPHAVQRSTMDFLNAL